MDGDRTAMVEASGYLVKLSGRDMGVVSMRTGVYVRSPYLRLLLTLFAAAAAASAAGLRYWVEPCVNPVETGCKGGDPELAQWAMEAWQAASDGKLRVEKTLEKER